MLELTEDSIVEMRGRAAPELAALRDLGVRIAIDDFGTGYSSLSYLNGFGSDLLKIDKVFLEQSTDEPSTNLLRALLSLADAVGAIAVAEGVESRGQVRLLRHAGLRFVQGHLFGCPHPAAEEPAHPMVDPRAIPADL